MRGSITLAVVPVLAVLAAPVAGARAYAEPPPSADLRMVYEQPQLTKDASGVTWHWVLTNTGTAGAETVVATHRVSADQKIVGVSQPCAGVGEDVVCRFGAIRPGDKRTGWIRTSVAKAGGTLRVNAQVTWRESPSIAAGLGDPSTVDAGDTAAPSGTESWGASDTDAATDMPGRSG